MKAIFTILFCLFAAGAPARAEEMPWQFDYEQALAQAKAAHKLVLLDFSASWCGPCRMMETTTFADAGAQAAMKPFLLVKIDLDRQPMIAARHKVSAIPTCIVLNPFGEPADRHTGYIAAAAFTQWLQTAARSPIANAKEPKSAEAERAIRQLGQTLDQPDAAARDKAVTALLTLYCAQDAARPEDPDAAAPTAEDAPKRVEAELRGLVERHPETAARYLNEPRLAVRILFATLFAEKAAGEFPFDPWAPSEERAASAEAWIKQAAAGKN